MWDAGLPRKAEIPASAAASLQTGDGFAAEADLILPDVFRALFVRLRTDAYLRAGSIDSKKLCRPDRILSGYDEIEDGL